MSRGPKYTRVFSFFLLPLLRDILPLPMARQEIVLRVFVSSPSDVSDEVSAVEAAVDEINATLPRDLGRRLEVVTWRTDATPGVSTDPQSVINEQIGENYDIFLGILWARFGTPTPRAESGSEEEFERAYARHTSDPGCVRVMVYFKKAPTDIDRIDPRQLEATRAFRSKLGPKGVLYWDFDTREDLQSHVRIHLSRQVHDWGKTWGTNSQASVSNEVSHATKDALAEEGLLDLIERGTGEFQIAAEAVERITKLHEQISSRTDGKALQLNALGSLPEKERSKLGKLICNSIAVDLEQFAKGISGEAEVFHEHFLNGVEAFSKSFTYTEFYSIETIRAGEPQFNETLSGFSIQIEHFEHSMLGLRGAIGALPRITTQFNRAKAAAVAAIDEWRRYAAGAMDWVRELKRNLEALKLRFAEQGDELPMPPQTPP